MKICIIKKICYRILNYFAFLFNGVSYVEFPHIYGFIYINNNGIIELGKNLIVNSDVKYNPTSGLSKCYWTVCNDSKIIIGNNVGMSNCIIYASSNGGITISDNAMIGSGTKIWDADFHSINYMDRINYNRGVSAPIVVKEGAWIGGCVIILKGVTIGRHSIVGAGSVVTKDVPDNEIWAGNPACFIKKVDEK